MTAYHQGKKLKEKLHKLNFSKDSLRLVTNYLSDRKQFVQIDDRLSSREKTNFRVPQGSILGPILFNIYVSDMNETCKNSTCLQYADDSDLYKHCKPQDIANTIIELQKTLGKVYNWSEDKNLIFNPNKTKFMVFTSKQSIHKTTNLTFQADENTNSTKILGVNFQEQLCWDNHINEVTKSCYATLSVLRKIKKLTPFSVRKQLCESLVLSKLQYCNTVIDPLTNIQERRLQKVQNSAAAFVFNRYCRTYDVI
jgi:hypothetical protein